MSKRFWLARAERGSMMINGLCGVYENLAQALDARIFMQGNTDAGLSGDTYVVLDSIHLPQRPDVPLPDVNVDNV